jgi:hypothetical protein
VTRGGDCGYCIVTTKRYGTRPFKTLVSSSAIGGLVHAYNPRMNLHSTQQIGIRQNSKKGNRRHKMTDTVHTNDIIGGALYLYFQAYPNLSNLPNTRSHHGRVNVRATKQHQTVTAAETYQQRFSRRLLVDSIPKHDQRLTQSEMVV